MNQDITERDKIIVDMYGDVQAMQQVLKNVEKTVNSHTDSIENIEKDIHAVKVSARLIKWVVPVIGALAGFASSTVKNILKGAN